MAPLLPPRQGSAGMSMFRNSSFNEIQEKKAASASKFCCSMQIDECGGILVVCIIGPLKHNRPEKQKTYIIKTTFEIISTLLFSLGD